MPCRAFSFSLPIAGGQRPAGVSPRHVASRLFPTSQFSRRACPARLFVGQCARIPTRRASPAAKLGCVIEPEPIRTILRSISGGGGIPKTGSKPTRDDAGGRIPMKIAKLDIARAVLIARSHWDVPVLVRLRPYVQFSRRLDGQLQQLVARWGPPGAVCRLRNVQPRHAPGKPQYR